VTALIETAIYGAWLIAAGIIVCVENGKAAQVRQRPCCCTCTRAALDVLGQMTTVL
jgi:hypothetical protein